MEYDQNVWPRHAAQVKQRAMYSLRCSIHKGLSVENGLSIVQNVVGKRSKPLVINGMERASNEHGLPILDEALLAKDPADGQNLLTYAASCGRKEWFSHLVGHIRQQLGVSALVDELRETDQNGAPLLFHAASSRTASTCFTYVRDTIHTILARGGLVEQFMAHDHKGRNIMMYAARSNHVHVFKRVRDSYRRAFPEECWQEQVDHLDDTQRSMLHHAAQAGCLDVLQEVLKMYLVSPGQTLSARPDHKGRTPIMHVLRRKYGDCEGRDDLDSKFNLLWEKTSERKWLVVRPVLARDQIRSIGAEGITEFMHAARGGPRTLSLALEKVQASQLERCKEDSGRVDLDEVLGMDLLPIAGPKELDDPSEGNISWEDYSQDYHLPRIRAWGWGMLLAAAAKSGHVKVLDAVVKAIKTGSFCSDHVTERSTNGDPRSRIMAAMEAVSESGRSLVTLAVLSHCLDAVKWVYHNLLVQYYSAKEVWTCISGTRCTITPLTCAASSSMTDDQCGVKMFDLVYDLVRQAANANFEQEEMTKMVLSQISPRAIGRATMVSPLAGAAFSSNWVLFQRVYHCVELFNGRPWSRLEVFRNVPKTPPERLTGEEQGEMHECKKEPREGIRHAKARISAVMWRDIVEAYQRATAEGAVNGNCSQRLPSWRDDFSLYSRAAVDFATESRTFDDLRDLVKEGFPLHDDHICDLLHHIEDHEQDIIDIVMFAVGNASNPLVTGAGVSRHIDRAEADFPMHRAGLRRLQQIIDDLTIEILDALPHTVRGMGMTLLRPSIPQKGLPPRNQRTRDILATLAGFIVVEWILEPHLLSGQATRGTRYPGPKYLDPLKRALIRASKALDFLNTPLVLDYVHIKFSCTLPHWASRNPFQPTINEGFYQFDGFDMYDDLSELTSSNSSREDDRQKRFHASAWDSFLLRFLQGWDARHITGYVRHEAQRRKPTIEKGQGGSKPSNSIFGRLDWSRFPHSTLLPGLQFSLAGIIGKPETYFSVPAIRFAFETLSYLVMLGLFGSAVLLQDSHHIPLNERMFYLFVVGLVWREMLEFLDAIPARRPRQPHQKGNETARFYEDPDPRDGGGKPVEANEPEARSVKSQSDIGLNRLSAAFVRYMFYDTWNLLDTTTIGCALLALVFRVIGAYSESHSDTGASGDEGEETNVSGDFFFLAQFFLALSAPLLFARLLLLTQIDSTLGPMTQIIWRMMSHTLRFSVFILVIMTGFALAFHALFFKCPMSSTLGDEFGRFDHALLSVFEAALGVFDFSAFDHVYECPELGVPSRSRSAGHFLLVAYLVVMAIVLFNLLIAVLSTAHEEVNKHAEKEFQLARARLIVQSGGAVANLRVPPPFNLLQAILGVVADGVGEAIYRTSKSKRTTPRFRDAGRNTRTAEADKDDFIPITSTYDWYTFDGYVQRLLFALTMGSAAVVLSAVLWIASIPWVSWSLLRWVVPPGESVATGTKRRQHATFVKTNWIMLKLAVWVLTMIPATVLCGVCILGSIVLWFRGLWGVWKWRVWRNTEGGKKVSGETELHHCPTAMPGQEHGDHWRHAWHIAKLRNYRMRTECDSMHFNIAPLLKSTTGLDLEHLALLIKKKDERFARQQNLNEMDNSVALAGGYLLSNLTARHDNSIARVTPTLWERALRIRGVEQVASRLKRASSRKTQDQDPMNVASPGRASVLWSDDAEHYLGAGGGGGGAFGSGEVKLEMDGHVESLVVGGHLEGKEDAGLRVGGSTTSSVWDKDGGGSAASADTIKTSSLTDCEFSLHSTITHTYQTGEETSVELWRDGFGYVEIKVATVDLHILEQVKLLNKAYFTEIDLSGKPTMCIVDPVVDGPSGARFSVAATISYHVGRYDDLLMTSGGDEQKNKDGIAFRACEEYVPAVKRDVSKQDQSGDLWEQDGEFTAIWKGDELWLEKPLTHFSEHGRSKRVRFRDIIRARGYGAKRPQGSPELEPPGSLAETKTESEEGVSLIENVDLPPRSSGSRQNYSEREASFHNATQRNVRIYASAHSFNEIEENSILRQGAVGVGVGGVGVNAAGEAASSSNITRKLASHVFEPLQMLLGPNEKHNFQLPGHGQASLIWFSVSEDFTAAQVEEGTSPFGLSATRLRAFGYNIEDGKFLDAQEASPEGPTSHDLLQIVRVWHKGTIGPHNLSRIYPGKLEQPGLKDFIIPIAGEPSIETKLADFSSTVLRVQAPLG